MNKVSINILAFMVSFSSFFSMHAWADSVPIEKLKVPAGYKVEVWQDHVPGARSLTQGQKGTVFVGTRDKEVYAIRNHQVYTIAKNLNSPNGVAFKNGDLYVGEISRLSVLPKIEDHLASPPQLKVIYDRLPDKAHHGWKFISFGPDGYLYVPIGVPCNICEDKDLRFGTILRFKTLDGKDPEIFAKGIRNTVGFDWSPATKQLWFSENGRDELGDDIPDDELNHAPTQGMHFGFPYCHAGDIVDKEFGKGKSCKDYTPPDLKLGAHVAALGMRFLDENTILIAEHGSWNRSKKVGYRVMKITLKNGMPVKQEPFLEGFLDGENAWGRPVDVEILKDRSVLVSDDEGGRIFRVFKP